MGSDSPEPLATLIDVFTLLYKSCQLTPGLVEDTIASIWAAINPSPGETI